MEIIITMNEEGKFNVSKSDSISVFTAVGMLELAKKVMLTPDTEKPEEEAEELIEEEKIDMQ